jgi:hypothetical protein
MQLSAFYLAFSLIPHKSVESTTTMDVVRQLSNKAPLVVGGWYKLALMTNARFYYR